MQEILFARVDLNELSAVGILKLYTTAVVTEEQALDALKRGLTRWRDETPEGLQAWEEASQDFNIGDLAGCYTDPVLKSYLEKEGVRIVFLEVNGYEGDYRPYDELLIHGDRLP